MERERELNRTEIESRKKSYSAPVLEEIGSVGGRTMGTTSGPSADAVNFYDNAISQTGPSTAP